MKSKNYFLLTLASMAFMACTNEDMIGTGHEVMDNETAWISLGIRKPISRALNNPNEHNGTAGETVINSVKILFFNGHTDGSVLTNVVDFSTASVPEVTTAPKAFKVSKSAKALLIIANPGTIPALSSLLVGTTTYDAVNNVVTPAAGVDDVIGGSSLNSFMMTNAKGGLEPSVSGTGAPQNLALYPTAADAESNTLTLFVDRVAAKVRVQASKTSDVATIGDVYWVLNVKNKKYFPVSKRTKTFFDNATPHDIYGLGSYRIDPNYNHTSLAWGGPNYGNEYSYYTDAVPPATWLAANVTIDGADPGDNAPAVEYCLENTQREDDNLHAYTTHVLLKTTFIPKAYQLPDLSTTTVQETDNDWIAIKGGFYTYATLLEWVSAELTNKYKDTNPDGYATELTGYLNNYIVAALGAAKKVELPSKTDFDTSGKTNTQQAADLKAAFAALEADIKAKGAFSDGTVSYYSGAESYYKVMIKHDDSDADNNKLGEFGVVRNSVYDIIVTKFNNPGYPTIPDPDPNTPDEAESFLSLEIKVNPWTWYRQVEEL